MNWNEATVAEINAACAGCDPAWHNGEWNVKWTTGEIQTTQRGYDVEYLTVLDGHEELTEYGSRLIRLANDKPNFYARLAQAVCESMGLVFTGQELTARTAARATPRQRLHAACDVLERKEE